MSHDDLQFNRDMKYFVSFVCICLVLGMGIAWVVQGTDFVLYQMFAPKMESARREAFESSKAYNDGMQQELQAMQFEYIKASPEHKAALASVILHRVAGYDEKKLSVPLQQFLNDLRYKR